LPPLFPWVKVRRAICTVLKDDELTYYSVWIIYPFRTNPVTGKQGVAELFYDLGPKARNEIAI
jgi:hypothetical protein